MPVKLPSITQAVADARDTYLRFPFLILDAIIGTMCALILIDYAGPSGPTVLMRIVFGAVLAFPLLGGLAIVSEKMKWGRAISLGLQCAGVALAGLYSLTVPLDIEGAPHIHVLRLAMLTAGMVLFVFSAPYVRHENELGYWNYCKTLCLRAITAGLYAVVLYGGLAIALAALDVLFGVHIPGKRYAELWLFINGIFTTWFFLAGIPKELDSLDRVTDYPKGLQIFSQYILFPLVLVYLVILYAYLGKILLAWDWPKGWVSGLTLGFVATGFASLLLLHPIRDRIENRWINTASRWFYVVIIPLTVMLFLAIWRRVSEYGITEGRYLGLATVVWLCVVTAYFIFSRKKKILFIAASLCVEVFVVSIGPWGMFAVSENSQAAHLKNLLIENKILVGGRVQSAHAAVPFETTKQISSIVGYLRDVHGFDAIQPWFGESLKEDSAGKENAYKRPELVTKLMGIEYVNQWATPPGEITVLSADREGAMDIGGYERLLRGRSVGTMSANGTPPDQGIAFRFWGEPCMMTVALSPDGNAADSLQIDLKPLVDALIAEYGGATKDNIPPEKMAIAAANRTARVKVFFSSIRIKRRNGKPEMESFDAEIAYTQMKN
jgi:hypothetical protein